MPARPPHPISRRQLLFATGAAGAAAAAGLFRPARALATSGPAKKTLIGWAPGNSLPRALSFQRSAPVARSRA